MIYCLSQRLAQGMYVGFEGIECPLLLGTAQRHLSELYMLMLRVFEALLRWTPGLASLVHFPNLFATRVKYLGRRLFLFQERESWEQQARSLLGEVFPLWLFWKCLVVVMRYNTSDYQDSRETFRWQTQGLSPSPTKTEEFMHHFPKPCSG